MFITFEGPEGGGKTSVIPKLAERLRQEGFEVLTTREPGGTDIGDEVRAVIMDLKHKDKMSTRSEILLFQASRAQLVEEVIQPALDEGKVVLCDRYADSTLAYQGYGHEIDRNVLRQIIDFATGGLQPDLTLFLDISVEEGLQRRGDDGGWNRMDDYEQDFHQRVYKGYMALIGEEPQRWEIVPATQSPDQVAAQVEHIVLNFLKKHKRKIAKS